MGEVNGRHHQLPGKFRHGKAFNRVRREFHSPDDTRSPRFSRCETSTVPIQAEAAFQEYQKKENLSRILLIETDQTRFSSFPSGRFPINIPQVLTSVENAGDGSLIAQ
jgi:hypothetical protein